MRCAAAQTLKVDWEPTDGAVPGRWTSCYEHIRGAKVVKREDEVKNGRRRCRVQARPASRWSQAEYEWPFQSHASMGPACAVAEIKDGSCTVWTGSQKPHFVRDGVARLLGMPAEKVRAIWVAGPGSYGRNDAGDAAMDAAFLAQGDRQAGARAGHARRRHGVGPERPGVRAPRARGARCDAARSWRTSSSRKASRASTSPPTNRSPRTAWSARSIGVPPKPHQIFGAPAESYGFENKLLGWEDDPAVRRALLAAAHLALARPGRARDPFRLRAVHRRGGARRRRGSGRLPSASYLTRRARIAAVVKAVAREVRLGIARQGARASRSPTATARRSRWSRRSRSTAQAGRVWARKFWVAHDCGLIINPEILRPRSRATWCKASRARCSRKCASTATR